MEQKSTMLYLDYRPEPCYIKNTAKLSRNAILCIHRNPTPLAGHTTAWRNGRGLNAAVADAAARQKDAPGE